jgi:hypothetical protein
VRPYHADAQSASLREKRLSRHPRAFPRKAMRPRLAPPRRGGLRTPTRKAQRQLQRCLPLATGLSSTYPVGMECHGLRTALPPGRGDRAPPRKTPFAPSPGSPRKATSPWLAPWRGGLRTPVTTTQRQLQRCLLLATGSSFAPNEYVIFRLASGPHLRTRRPRPSEKTASRAIPGLSLQGHAS